MTKGDELDSRREEDRCPSVNLHGIPCRGKRDHAALHNAEVDGVLYVWSDQSSPTLAIDLLRPEE